ncbi:5,10-methenyltetrahydrofolate synthetase [Saccharomonospora marina XMU15]|uniref:5-formyltetrahydrofolate cyclo-ligase n=1 Tax=Saccharomonospora marina XMU15 TaxID=882083 RepID=H5WWX0_9PSEU|nr:5-formyltetrahydrofolate cyclo-ligase [Saccharomonospora marina]EHR52798.1 5,10-methenyltetrahydrofolate synthetase [Saccharomonospora marina XMU15]
MNETDNDNPPAGVKAQWRARMKAGRAAISAQQRVLEAAALTEAVAGMAATTMCCYVPFGSEPGSIALLDVLLERGTRVLLPVVPAEPGPLDWAEYTGTSALAKGNLRPVLEPQGPRLGPKAIAEADVVLVPALAVDRSGVRLGRGAGYYDRSLSLVSATAELVAVIRDTEFVDQLPAEPHDVRMTAVLTPSDGLRRLPSIEPSL